MKAADTNIIVRAITGDDAVQTPIALAIIDAGILLPVTIVMETEWVLRSWYKYKRADIAAAILDIIDSETVTTPDEPAIRWALTRYAAGADLADMLHLTRSRRADAFVTFDQALAAEAGPTAPVTIEIAA